MLPALPGEEICSACKTYAQLKNSENRLCLMENICYDDRAELYVTENIMIERINCYGNKTLCTMGYDRPFHGRCF